MGVMIVLPETDARAMFPEEMDMGPPDPRTYMSAPSVLWLVVDEPQACEMCRGSGEQDAGILNATMDCPDCGGTGLPTVEILTCGIELTEYEAGTLTIGKAVPVLSVDWCRSLSDTAIDIIDGLVHINWGLERHADITHQFGGQDVTPGRWAHPILTGVR